MPHTPCQRVDLCTHTCGENGGVCRKRGFWNLKYFWNGVCSVQPAEVTRLLERSPPGYSTASNPSHYPNKLTGSLVLLLRTLTGLAAPEPAADEQSYAERGPSRNDRMTNFALRTSTPNSVSFVRNRLSGMPANPPVFGVVTCTAGTNLIRELSSRST